MKFNSKIGVLLTPALIEQVQRDGELHAALRKRLDPGLVLKDDAVFLKSEYKITLKGSNGKLSAPSDFSDLTGWECFVNHVHVSDYVKGSAKIKLEQAMMFAFGIAKQLQKRKVYGSYCIIITLMGGECIVRFHRNQPGESWLANSLERYEEGVLCLSTEVREKAPGFARFTQQENPQQKVAEFADADLLLTA